MIKLVEKELVILRPDIDDGNVKRIYKIEEVKQNGEVIVSIEAEEPLSC